MKVGDLVQLRHGTIGLIVREVYELDELTDDSPLKVFHILAGDSVMVIHEIYGMIEVISESR